MLIFEGKLSKKNQKRIIKKTFCIACLSIVFSLVVVSTIVLIFGREFIDIAIIVVPLAELIVFLIVFFLLKYSAPIYIKIIAADKPIYVKTKFENFVCHYSNIKKIKDYGDSYSITFQFPYKYPFCICQKDLLRQGTLTEFEKMFQNKIVSL